MLDTVTKLSMLQERFKSETEQIFLKSLEDALQIIAGKMVTQDATMAKRLIEINKLIEAEIGSLYGSLVEPLQADMQEFAELEYRSIFTAINETAGLGYAFASLPKELMKEIVSMDKIHLVGDKGYSLGALLDDASKAQVNRYKQIVAGGLASNDGYQNITKRLKQANLKATTDLFAIVHTSISSARDTADAKAYEDFSDVITGWESVAVLDSRTSLLCASLDGRKYYKKKGYPTYDKIPNRPPRHFRCRSRLIPITDFKTDTTRAESGDNQGQISAKTNFEEWFSKQSESFKEQYLGKGRYDLYKDGRLKIKDFVDIKTGERFTIKEIKEKFFNLPDLPKVQDLPKPIKDTLRVDLGHGKKFNDYIDGIRGESLGVIHKLPKPYEIKDKGRHKGSYYLNGNKLTDKGTVGTLVSMDKDGQATFLHEYGHHIDYVGEKDALRGSYTQLSMRKEFLEARRLDIDHLKEKFKGQSIYTTLVDRWKGKKDMWGMSDIFDSMSLGVFFNKYRMPGHGTSYYNSKSPTKKRYNQSKQQTEVFANLFEAYSSNGTAWKEALEIFPNQARVFESIIKDLLNG